MKIAITFICILFVLSCTHKYNTNKHIFLEEIWKFRPGDSLAYANPNFDDADWDTIHINNPWRNQCNYAGYRGYAWYRAKIVIPSSLKDSSYFKDSIKIYLGKICEFDQVYLNGWIIGKNTNSLPPNTIDTASIKDTVKRYVDTPRIYTLAANDKRILWNKENVIAIRVFSSYDYMAGLYSGLPYLGMKSLEDYLSINQERFYRVDTLDKVDTNLVIKNTSSKFTVKGILNLSAKNIETQKLLLNYNYFIYLKPGQKKVIPISFDTTTDRIGYVFSYNDLNYKTNIRNEDTLQYVLWKY